MTLPFFSCICLTYGRPQHLEEAIACFNAQEYQGERELVIFNTCPQQTLEMHPDFASPRIRIINCVERPASLGESRNYAIDQAVGSHIVTWDDDDLYLPNHLQNFADHFEDQDWVWQCLQFYSVNWKIQKLTAGTQNVVAYSRRAWERAGRFAGMNCGEDRDFVGRLTSTCKGKKAELNPEQASFIYCWGNEAYHVSGLGDDVRGRMNSWKRAERDFLNRLRRRREQSGRVVLTPKLRMDYVRSTREFLTRSDAKMVALRDDAILLLGRFGDLVNLLPVLKLRSLSGAKPTLIVAKAFASLLNGVSYVDPWVVDLDFSEVNQARRKALGYFKSVTVAQVWGKHHQVERKFPSFNQESWGLLGEADKFHDFTLRPEFDRRNPQRESALVQKYKQLGKPLILVGVTGGRSSPFKLGGALLNHVVAQWSATHTVVDLCSLYLEQIYDLLGLFDAAQLLITADTVYLHLAAASEIPVIAFVNPAPWLGSDPRLDCVAKIPYPNRLDVQQLDQIISGVLSTPINTGQAAAQKSWLMIHASEFHKHRIDARMLRATQSWVSIYSNGVLKRHLERYPRNAKDIGDKRSLPYLKDVLEHAMKVGSSPGDIIMFTNDDNWIHPELPEYLRQHMSESIPCCCSQRSEFWDKRVHPESGMSPDQIREAGALHPGRDMFAFTRDWLQRNWDRIPDYILGASDWDWGMCAMIRLHYGIRTTRKNIDESIFPADIPVGYIAHEHHTPVWIHPNNESSAPSQQHNRSLFRTWAAKEMPEMEFDLQGRLLR